VSENENHLSIRIYYYLSYIIDETHIKPGGIMISSDICNIKIKEHNTRILAHEPVFDRRWLPSDRS